MRALIFTTHTGGGRDAAAHAMEQALATRGVDDQSDGLRSVWRRMV